MLERGAHVLIQTEDIFVLCEAFAIWWVDHDECAIGVAFSESEFLHTNLLNLDITLEIGRLDILGSSLYGIEARIGTIDLVVEIAFAAIVAVDVLKEVGVAECPNRTSGRRNRPVRSTQPTRAYLLQVPR